jgi:hypothetical protein
MTASTPDQRRLNPREALSLIIAGGRAWLRIPVRATHSPAWHDAVRAFGYLTAATMAAMFAYRAVADTSDHLASGIVSPAALGQTIGWTLVAIALRLGSHVLAAVGAIAGAAGQAVTLAQSYLKNPGGLVISWWHLVLAVTAAAALITLVRPARERTAGRSQWLTARSQIAVALAAILFAAAPALESLTLVITPTGPNSWTSSYREPFGWFALSATGYRPVVSMAVVVLAVTLAVVVVRLRPTVRRRVLVLTLPVGVTQFVVAQTFGGFLASSPRFYPPVHLVTPQWTALVITPVLAFAVGAWLLARYERRLDSGALRA